MWGLLKQKYWMLRHRGQKVRFDLQRARRWDAKYNRGLSPDKSKILVLRDVNWGSDYNEDYLLWLRETHPDLSARVRLARVPCFDIDVSDVCLFVPWLQDPLRELYPKQYGYAEDIQNRCMTNGAEVVNPIQRLSVSIKSVALPLMAELGVRTAKVVKIDLSDVEALVGQIPLPFFIRDDYRHGCPMQLIRDFHELTSVDWSLWQNPIAVEFIDTRCEDGLYRKYRYFLFGKIGHNRHLIAGEDWNVHAASRIDDPDLHRTEREFIAETNPHHKTFLTLKKELGLDFVAFDYSYDQSGELVVWEPNPFPVFDSSHTTPGNTPDFLVPLYEKLARFWRWKVEALVSGQN